MKTKVKTGVGKMTVPQLLVYSNHVVTKITGNVFFTTPSPALTKVASAITALQNAYNTAQGAGPAQTAAMNQCKEALQILLTTMGNYVEGVANDPVNAATGANAIILSAGMDVKSFSPHQKQTFSVSTGGIPGSVDLTAAHVDRGSHEWEYSPDIANVNGWISVDPTTQASTTITGLGIGKLYYFRHRSVTPDGPTDWDDPISIMVV